MFNRLYERFRPHRNTALFAIAVIAVALLLFWASQAANKTIWEYLEVLVIPAVLGVVAWLFSRAAKKRDRDIESDRQRQSVLATYFDRMSDLLLKHNLLKKGEDSDERIVARARTVSALRNLDGKRIAQLIQFLTESNLGGKKLLRIELTKADLMGVDLREADLQGAILVSANLQGAILVSANLQRAYLSEAKLQRANLNLANLQGVYLDEANLRRAQMYTAKLQGARMFKAKLQGARLIGAKLQGASFDEANLSQALVDIKQLSKASSLKNTIMPDGTRYEEWLAKGKPDWSKQKKIGVSSKRRIKL